MSDNISLSIFPKNKKQALAMLYLEKQDLTGITPVELAKKYEEAYGAISDFYDEVTSKKLTDFYK